MILDRVDKPYAWFVFIILFAVFHFYEAITVKVNMQSFHNIFIFIQNCLPCLFCFLSFFATFLCLDVTAFCKSLSCSSFVRRYKLVVLSVSVTVLFDLCSDFMSLLSFVWNNLLHFLNLTFFTKAIRSFWKPIILSLVLDNAKALIHTFLCSLIYYVFH